MTEPKNIIIREDSDITSPSPVDPSIIYISEDAETPSPPSPPPPFAHIGVAELLTRLLTPEQKELIDGATIEPIANTIVVRDDEGNIPFSIPRYVFLQTTSSSTWVVNHNLNTYPQILVMDNLGEVLIPNIQYTDLNTITILHSIPYSGKAILT